MENSQTDRREIQGIINSAYQQKLAVTLRIGNDEYSGRIEHEADSEVKIILALAPALGAKLLWESAEATFQAKGAWHRFISTVFKHSGRSLSLQIPQTLFSHTKRETPRFQVDDKQIQVKFQIISTAREEALRKSVLRASPALTKMLEELAKPVPDIAAGAKFLKNTLLTAADRVDLYLGAADAIPSWSKSILEKTGMPYFMPDTREDKNYQDTFAAPEGFISFAGWLKKVHPDKKDESAEIMKHDAQAEYYSRGWNSECVLPVKMADAVAGCLHMVSSSESGRLISEPDARLAQVMTDVFAEMLVKRNLNNAIIKDAFRVKLFDMSETGLGFQSNETLFTKILGENSKIRIAFQAAASYMELSGSLIRVNRSKTGQDDAPSFAMQLDPLLIAKKDLIAYKRALIYFQTA